MSRREHPRRRCRRALAALVAVAIAATATLALLGGCGGGAGLAAGEGPVVALQDDRLPDARADELATRLRMLAETGVDTARLDLLWGDIAPREPARPSDPDDPAYDWTRADAILTGYARAGITTIVSVYDTPAWAQRAGAEAAVGDRVNATFPRVRAFAEFMQAVARRYSGRFRPAGTAEELPRVAHLELWNEPNFSAFLGPQVRGDRRVAAEHYARMATAAYRAIKRVDADTVVIVGSGGPKGVSSAGATGARDWLRLLRARSVPLDAYSQHIYPAAAPSVATITYPSWSSIDWFLQAVDRWRPGTPLYVTEAGYTTKPSEYRRHGIVTEAEQARYLREIFELPQVNQERVAAIVWFNLQDNESWPAGLLREDGSRKPSYAVLQQLAAERRGHRLPGPMPVAADR